MSRHASLRSALAGLLVAVAVAGCGSVDAPPPIESSGTDTSATTPNPQAPGSDRRRSARGETRTVTRDGAPVYVGAQRGVAAPYIAFGRSRTRPDALDPANDLQIVAIRWRGWGKPSTIGTGSAKINRCRPSCASGKPLRRRGVRVELSRLRSGSCEGARALMYTRARIAYPPGRGLPRPGVTVLAPRCVEPR